MKDILNLTILRHATSRRQVLLGAAGAFAGLAWHPLKEGAGAAEEITHANEAIHQEVVFHASRKRIYEALTDAKHFDAVVKLSAAAQSGMIPPGKPAEISRDAGGAFLLFAGYISGRHIELLPNERIVQAWRAASWDPGIYSIAKFVLAEEGSGSKLIFDHTGFPPGQAEHLAQGWRGNYWEPLAKILA